MTVEMEQTEAGPETPAVVFSLARRDHHVKIERGDEQEGGFRDGNGRLVWEAQDAGMISVMCRGRGERR